MNLFILYISPQHYIFFCVLNIKSIFTVVVLTASSVNLSSVSFLYLFLLINISLHYRLYFPAFCLEIFEWIPDIKNLMLLGGGFFKVSLNTFGLCFGVQFLGNSFILLGVALPFMNLKKCPVCVPLLKKPFLSILYNTLN